LKVISGCSTGAREHLGRKSDFSTLISFLKKRRCFKLNGF